MDAHTDQTVTIYKIAAEAGVSISTVSRVLNGKDLVSPKTKSRIQKVIQKYNYAPSQTARCMVNKKSKTIGIIIPEIRNSFFAMVISDVDKILYQHGYSILLYNCEFSPERESKAIDDIIGRNADGLILLSSGIDGKAIKNQIKNRIHVVCMHSNLNGVDTINVMNYHVFSEVAEHLIFQGHRDIACIGGNTLINLRQQERIKGYLDTLKKHAIKIRKELIFSRSGANDNSVLLAAKRILRLKHPPTAIMATNDYTAIDIYQAASEMGMKVGADIAVTGFDNTPVSALMNPTLTTVDTPTKLIAEIATDFLLKRLIKNDQSEPKEVVIPGRLIIRDSSTQMKLSP
jgi:DNA-binding LacI/PurR family transcriptional regulator